MVEEGGGGDQQKFSINDDVFHWGAETGLS